MSRRTFRAIALALALALPVACTGDGSTDLVEVPRPPLDAVDDAVRDRILELRAAAETAPADGLAGAYGDLGHMYWAYGMQEAAEACFLNVSRLDDGDAAAHYFLALIRLEQGRTDEALERLQTVLDLEPGYTAALLRLGRAQVELGRSAEGRASLERAAGSPAYNAAAQYSLGRLAAVENDTAEAIARFERVLELQPEATRVHYALGQAYRKSGDAERAARNLELSGDRDVTFPDPLTESLRALTSGVADILNTSGRAYFEGEFEAAAAGYRRALALEPEHVEAHKGLALALERLGDLAGSEAHFREALRLAPNDPDVARGLGILVQSRGDVDAGLRLLERAIEIDPGSADARLALAGALIQAGRIDEAGNALNDMLQLDLDPAARARALYNLGIVVSLRGDEEASRLRFREAIEADPTFGQARLMLGGSLARAGAFGRAADEFARLVEREPGHVQARLAEATAQLFDGAPARARERLEQGLAETGDPLLALALAKLLATAPDAAVRDGARAVDIARRLHDAAPSLEHREVLAMALAETGDFAAAVGLQRRLVAEAREMGQAGLLEQFQRDLARYERREPSRTP